MTRRLQFVAEQPSCSQETPHDWNLLAGMEVEVFVDEVAERFGCDGKKYRLTGTSKTAIFERTGRHHHRPFHDIAVCEHEVTA